MVHKYIMARKMNPLRYNTPIALKKSTKTMLRRIARDHPDRAGTESDETIVHRILAEYCKNHPDEIREPQTTYRNKPTS